jgi:hypothetical protein
LTVSKIDSTVCLRGLKNLLPGRSGSPCVLGRGSSVPIGQRGLEVLAEGVLARGAATPAATGRRTPFRLAACPRRSTNFRRRRRTGLRHIRVEHVPTALLNGAKSHLDDLVRDFALVNEAAAAQGRTDQQLVDLAARLSHLAAELVGFRNQVRRQAIEAVQRGAPTLTLHLNLP